MDGAKCDVLYVGWGNDSSFWSLAKASGDRLVVVLLLVVVCFLERLRLNRPFTFDDIFTGLCCVGGECSTSAIDEFGAMVLLDDIGGLYVAIYEW